MQSRSRHTQPQLIGYVGLVPLESKVGPTIERWYSNTSLSIYTLKPILVCFFFFCMALSLLAAQLLHNTPSLLFSSQFICYSSPFYSLCRSISIFPILSSPSPTRIELYEPQSTAVEAAQAFSPSSWPRLLLIAGTLIKCRSNLFIK